MIFILIIVFFAGTFVSSQMEDEFIYIGLFVFGAGIIQMNKKIKMSLKK